MCYFSLFQSMPWGELSHLAEMVPTKSNDGPILWIRPGEQSIPTVELGKSPLKRRRYFDLSKKSLMIKRVCVLMFKVS